MADLIDRDAVEDIITNALNGYLTDDVRNTVEGIGIAISDIPSAQPERLTDDDFETIRIHLSAYKEQLGNQSRWKEAEEYQRIIDRFMSFASAQPEPHESFTDLINRQMAIDEAYAVIVDDAVYDVVQVETLEGLPSVDAVKIVRCKNCKHRCFDNRFGFMCDLDTGDPYEMGRNAYADDWFCADGGQKNE